MLLTTTSKLLCISTNYFIINNCQIFRILIFVRVQSSDNGEETKLISYLLSDMQCEDAGTAGRNNDVRTRGAEIK